MPNAQNDTMSNGLFCWLVAAGVGLLAFVLLSTIGDTGLIARFAAAIVIFLVLGLVLYAIFGKSLEPLGAAKPVNADAPSAPAPRAAAPSAPASAAAAAPAGNGHWTDDVSASSPEAGEAPAGGSGQSEIKPSTDLPGEATLREDVGSWKYEGEAAPEPAEKPATLEGPRDGSADDLKKIKGVGPKMEGLLNSMGFFHFDQVAAWTDAEVAWVDDNLEGFKGRVSRDNWVEQAKLLASGGETEFSKKVGEGGVY